MSTSAFPCEIFMNSKGPAKQVLMNNFLDYFINAKLGLNMYTAHSELVGVEK